MEKIVNKVKEFAKAFQKIIKGIIKKVKFFATQVGFIVLMIILIIFVILAIYVAGRTILHSLNIWTEGNEYAGIATTEDYEVLVSSVGYAGYESFITEQKMQEYLAFEYAVLIDVGNYLFQGQKEYLRNPVGNPAYMPYLPVTVEYNIANMTHEDWMKAVLAGQSSARFGITNSSDLPSISDSSQGGGAYTVLRKFW